MVSIWCRGENIKVYVVDDIEVSVPKSKLVCVFRYRDDITGLIDVELLKAVSNFSYELDVNLKRGFKTTKNRKAQGSFEDSNLCCSPQYKFSRETPTFGYPFPS